MSVSASVLPFLICTTALSGYVTSALTTPVTFSSADRTRFGQLTGQVIPEMARFTVSCCSSTWAACGVLISETGEVPNA